MWYHFRKQVWTYSTYKAWAKFLNIIENNMTERSSCPQAWRGQKWRKHHIVHATFHYFMKFQTFVKHRSVASMFANALKMRNVRIFQYLSVLTLVKKDDFKWSHGFLHLGFSTGILHNSLVSGSSHIRSVLIGVEYQNCRLTLDVYLLFAI